MKPTTIATLFDSSSGELKKEIKCLKFTECLNLVRENYGSVTYNMDEDIIITKDNKGNIKEKIDGAGLVCAIYYPKDLESDYMKSIDQYPFSATC